MSKLFIHRNWQ